jgi:PAS domain-containing protein
MVLHPKALVEKMKQRTGFTGLEWLRQFLLILLPFAAILAVGVYVHYYAISETQRLSLEQYAPVFWGFIRQYIPLFFALFVVLLFASWLLVSANLRHRNAQRQSEYERRFRRALEDMWLAAITLDNEYRPMFCNDYFLTLTGWSREDVFQDE